MWGTRTSAHWINRVELNLPGREALGFKRGNKETNSHVSEDKARFVQTSVCSSGVSWEKLTFRSKIAKAWEGGTQVNEAVC